MEFGPTHIFIQIYAPGRATPRLLAADDVTVETYYYGHQSVLIGCRSSMAHIFPPTDNQVNVAKRSAVYCS